MKNEDKELLKILTLTVRDEKRLTVKVLELLQKVEERKLYADIGCRSLFAYCVDHLYYSEAEASVRVNATRLVREMPELKEEIRKGKIGLTQASRTQSLFRAEKINSSEKKEVIRKIRGKSARETEIILSEYKTYNKREKKLVIKERLLKKIETIQDEFEGLSELEVIEALVDRHIEKRERSRPARKSKKPSLNVRYIKREAKESIDLRSGGRCEYISPQGVRCNCRTELEYDHVCPVALGGKSIVLNLRKICRTHNQRAAIKVFGADFMNVQVLRGRPREIDAV